MHMIFATVGREGRDGVSDLPLVVCDSDRPCKGTYSNRKGEGVGMSETRSLFPRPDGCCFMGGFYKYYPNCNLFITTTPLITF